MSESSREEMGNEIAREALERAGRELGKPATELRIGDLKDWLAISEARWEQVVAARREFQSTGDPHAGHLASVLLEEYVAWRVD